MKIGDCLVVAKLHTSRVLLVFIIFNVACIEVLLFFYHFLNAACAVLPVSSVILESTGTSPYFSVFIKRIITSI